MPRTTTLPPRAARLGIALLAGAAAALSNIAHAEVPAVLDRVPKNIVAVLATPAISRLDKNLAAMTTAAQLPGVPINAMLGALGISAGLALDKPFAIALVQGDMKAALPPILVLAPVTDYGAMVKSLGGSGDALAEIKIQGDTFFIKQIDGGYAALSPLKPVLEGFDGKGGNLPAHAELMGKNGEDVAGDADAFVFFHRDELQKLIDSGFNPFQGPLKMLSQQGLGVQLNGMTGPLMKDATGVVMGLRASPMGASIDVSANYKPGAEMAKAFADAGDSKPVLKNLPSDSYILAWSADMSKPGMRSLVNSVAGDRAVSKVMLDPALFASPERLNSYAGIIYPNPAGLFGGLLARGLRFYGAANNQEFLDAFAKAYESLNNKADNAIQVSTSVKPSDKQVEGVAITDYMMKATSAGGSGSPLALFFGPNGGPSGAVAATKSGVYASTVADPKLIAKAISLGNAATGPAFLDDRPTAQVASALPPGRSAELYLGAKGIFDAIAPLIAMGGRQIDYTPPADLPPIGVALITGGGQLKVSAVVPAPVMTTFSKLSAAMQAPPPKQPGNDPNAKPAF